MTKYTKELIFEQIEGIPEDYLEELLEFIAFLRFRKEKRETHLASQATLAKDWLDPQEDQAWQNL